MKHRLSEEAQRILVLLKLDARRVFERIKYREQEYLNVFSMKRTRAHFSEIFKNRYDFILAKDLILCSQEVIVGLDQFYTKVDEIRWYLNVTEDMPSRVTDKMHHHIKELEKFYDLLTLYINAELGLEQNHLKPFEADSDLLEPDPYAITGLGSDIGTDEDKGQ